MEEAIKIVEAKLAAMEGLIEMTNIESFLYRKYILQDILKELKSTQKK